jgi:hypothetical protein
MKKGSCSKVLARAGTHSVFGALGSLLMNLLVSSSVNLRLMF